LSYLSRIVFVVAAMIATSTSMSMAQECKPEIRATGSASLSEAGAKKNAITAWRREAIARFGEFHGDFASAKNGVTAPCARTLVGLWRCEAKGAPCLVQASIGSDDLPSIRCNSDDSKNCDPTVKWVQTVVAQNGCRTTVDGAIGENTRNAIKCFQKKKSLGETGEVDDKTGAALKAAYKP